MPEGISPNSLNPLSQVYLDSIAEGRLKSLEKASALSASDNPDDQDEARKIRVRHDYESLKKQIGKKKKPQKPAVAESVDFSHWRDDLREIVGGASPILSSNPAVSSEPNTGIHATDTQTAKKVTEKKVKNKIKINPEFKEAVEEIGGQLLEVKEVEDNGDEQPVDSEDAKQKKMQKDKETMLKKRIIRMKLRAVNTGADDGIVASYQPEIEGAVQYFYEQGINEEGLDQIIEEIGLDEFVNFVLDASQFLTEETEEGRPARKMNVRTLKSTKKKAAEIKADRSDVVKRGTPVDTIRRARAERSTKKPKLAQPAKPAVVQSVAKVKKTQPAKKPNKQSLRDRVGSAFKKGVERHKAAVSKNEFTKGVASGVKAVGKAVRDVDSVLKVNKKKTVNMQSYEPEGDTLSEVQVTKMGDAQQKAMQDAVLRKKEEDAVKKEKKALKKEEVEVSEESKRTTKGRWIDKKGRSHKFSVSTHTGDEVHVSSIVKAQYPAKRVVITGQSAEKKKKEAAKKKKEVKEESTFSKAMKTVFKKRKEEKKAEKAQDAGARAKRVLARKEYASKVSGSTENVPDDIRDSYEATKSGEVLSAFKRDPKVRKRFEKVAKREKGPGTAKNRAADAMLQTAKDTAKRKGDTSKSDDRYAYEEVVVERLGGKGTSRKAGAAKIHPTSGDWPDSDRGEGNKSARRAGKNVKAKSPTYLAHVHNKKKVTTEGRDKAFANVVARLQAKHGKDAVITKDNPPKPPTEAQKKEYAAHKAKIAAQDTRDDLEKSSQGRYSRKYSNRGSD